MKTVPRPPLFSTLNEAGDPGRVAQSSASHIARIILQLLLFRPACGNGARNFPSGAFGK
jgi:hypothetical protein